MRCKTSEDLYIVSVVVVDSKTGQWTIEAPAPVVGSRIRISSEPSESCLQQAELLLSLSSPSPVRCGETGTE